MSFCGPRALPSRVCVVGEGGDRLLRRAVCVRLTRDILAECDKSESREDTIATALALGTGCRRNELSGFTCRDIDLAERVAQVRRQGDGRLPNRCYGHLTTFDCRDELDRIMAREERPTERPTVAENTGEPGTS
jgi:integrase